MREENFEGAAEAYKESLRLNPKDERTRYNLSEAMRKIRKQKQDQKQNGGGESQENKPQQGDPGQQGNSGDSQDDKNGNGQKKQSKEGNSPGDKKNRKQKKGQGGSPQEGGNRSQLPNKQVDRMLDELMKNEAETKRRLAGNGGGGFTPKSGKDW